MDALRRLLGLGAGRNAPPAAQSSAPPVRDTTRWTLLNDGWDLEVVGESFHQDVLWGLANRYEPGSTSVRVPIEAALEPEPTNPADANAVVVRIEGNPVGHLSREDAELLQPGVVNLIRSLGGPIAVKGVVVGSRGMSLGVFLSFDPAEFGVERDYFPKGSHTAAPVQAFGPSATVSTSGTVRTGLSQAVATDEADDTYDLSWLKALPSDPVAGITKLREQLTTERDAIDRHFMYAALEERLYGVSKAFPSALTEFDRVCAAHDSEMHTIRPALVAKFGGLPLLEVYQRASIRHDKAGDWAEACRWATRGLEVYAGQALRPEAVEWLEKKVAKCEAKLSAPAKAERKPRPPAAPKAERPTTETLVCGSCGKDFVRTVARGRKPRLCPLCSPQPATQP